MTERFCVRVRGMHDLQLLTAAFGIEDWSGLAARQYKHQACTEAAGAFYRNMERANGALFLPGYAFMSGQSWQTCALGAGKKLLKRDDFGDLSQKEFDQSKAEIEALALVAYSAAEAKETDESRNNRFVTACQSIEAFAYKNVTAHTAIHDAFKSAVIQAWAAVEGLFEDVMKKLQKLHQEKLSDAARNRDVYTASRAKMYRAVDVIFEDDPEITSLVRDRGVSRLAALRHILIHNDGVVDADFHKDCREMKLSEWEQLPEGFVFLLNGYLVRGLIDPAIVSGYDFLRLADEWLGDH